MEEVFMTGSVLRSVDGQSTARLIIFSLLCQAPYGMAEPVRIP